uniref:Uncharacterized protein n=1 Tax=Romanomermis culicivorax TaxID=13658 RepID=A0A915L296_ROMCU
EDLHNTGSYITKFISPGPKNYTYSLYSPSTKQYHHMIKVRGITLSSDAMKKNDKNQYYRHKAFAVRAKADSDPSHGCSLSKSDEENEDIDEDAVTENNAL